jgi:hypothetical protein
VIIGRAATSPLPEALRSRLSPRISAIGSVLADFLLAGAQALSTRRSPPSAARAGSVLHDYSSEVAAIRAAGLTRVLTANQVEQLFTGFALDELRSDLTDVERCMREWKNRVVPARRATSASTRHARSRQAGITRARKPHASNPISAQWPSSAKWPLSIGWNSISGMSAGGFMLAEKRGSSSTVRAWDTVPTEQFPSVPLSIHEDPRRPATPDR